MWRHRETPTYFRTMRAAGNTGCKNIIQRNLSFIQASEIGVEGEKSHMDSGNVSFPRL